ncbi:MAG TPA: aminotransferase class V-fold PLP-dependent enzyme [Pseudoneobacillus sp.]|nr:aminotransferase class V-fold PLP-dependent enzyme [Pseudoneobacillus sp.]
MITAQIGSKTYRFSEDLQLYFKPFRENVIGNNQHFETPFGNKRILYADWTASGRLYRPIEQNICNLFGPFMANTHTESNMSGSFMTNAYKQAKKIIKKHVNANEQDVVILDGFGMTSVINKFQRLLGVRVPEKLHQYLHLALKERPVVFLTHMEHHSNQTSWLETICEVVVLEPNQDGEIDLILLDKLLKHYHDRKIKIGSFTACSNVTGVQTPYHQLAKIMHKHGGLCFVDFAASAPYIQIDMHPEDPMENLDAIFFSPHKFLGGPGTSGVLVFDSKLYDTKVPDHPGGGTVTWTNPWGQHKYHSNIESREDGGTPGILQAIRIALCLKLKEKMGTENILKREKELVTLVLKNLEKIPKLHVLDGHLKNRLGIISFFVEEIHYNLIVRLLNDRYGIQVRGGCSCAGTYGHYLYNIDKKTSQQITNKINDGDLSSKPGWVRFSVHPIMTNEEIMIFVQAMKELTMNIEEWKKDYVYDSKTNDFLYVNHKREDFSQLFWMD